MSDSSKLVTVIGRGHSGTRAIAATLQASGVYMGDQLNESSDLLPPGKMYDACRVLARHVLHNGGVNWDFGDLHAGAIDSEFSELIEAYLASVLNDTSAFRGWKIPETTLAYPWIARMFPEARYIYWYRDPRDSILGAHVTDDLSDFGIPYDRTDDDLERRAISWKYQYEIIRATPPPKNVIEVRFEDFVLNQEETLTRLEGFLGIPLARIEVRPDSVGRWKQSEQMLDFDFLAEDLKALGY